MRAAAAAGAIGIVCIGESRTAADGARALAARHPGLVFATAGVHPHDAATFDPAADSAWIGDALRAGAVAVGECGLDYHYDHSPRDRQRAAFRAQLALAAAAGRPVVVHTRDAETDTMAALQEAATAGVRGVLHCFTGSPSLAETALSIGWSVSFSGIVTFAKWDNDGVVRAIPEDRILVETDAPYLAPVPFRGRRNEPRYVPPVIDRLATVRGSTSDQMAALVTANAQRFFGLAIGPVP